MTYDTDFDKLDRDDLVVAHESIVNLLINDWSAMSRDQLKETESNMADALGYPEDSTLRYQG